jgi:hypothetical protein
MLPETIVFVSDVADSILSWDGIVNIWLKNMPKEQIATARYS